MSPQFRSRIRLFACAAPALALACVLTSAASAETPVTLALNGPAAPLAAAAPATFSVSMPTDNVFVTPEVSSSSSATIASVDSLPEAPQPVTSAEPGWKAFSFGGNSTGGTASKFSSSIPAGMSAQRLSDGDKVVLGFRNVASLSSVAGVIIGAGYSHLTDGQPNYGVDRTAFAQRFGAGMARSASQSIFMTSVLSPVFHQDTRYYVLGPQTNFFKRVTYAATRPIIGRTDGGHSTINASLLIGYAGAAALTRTYYPPINRNFTDEARTFGSSLGGAAIGFAFDEFSDQLLKVGHLKH